MSKQICPSTIEGIKRLAKTIKCEKRISHHDALNEAARCGGFENFRHAQNVIPSSSTRSQGFQATQWGVPITVHACGPTRPVVVQAATRDLQGAQLDYALAQATLQGDCIQLVFDTDCKAHEVRVPGPNGMTLFKPSLSAEEKRKLVHGAFGEHVLLLTVEQAQASAPPER